MGQPLRQSATGAIVFGPFLGTDGITALTTLTITAADIRLSKNNGSFVASAITGVPVHLENGCYSVGLISTDKNTLGPLEVRAKFSNSLHTARFYDVYPADVYDALFGTGALTATGLASTYFSTIIEGTQTFEQMTRVFGAALGGVVTTMSGTAPSFQGMGVTTTRITVSGADEFGNRPVITLVVT